MEHTKQTPVADASQPTRRKWWVVGIGATICLLSWLALGVGLMLGVDFTPRLILAAVAAVTTEALIWLTAGVFGLTVFQARQRIWRALRDAPKRLLKRLLASC